MVSECLKRKPRSSCAAKVESGGTVETEGGEEGGEEGEGEGGGDGVVE